MPTLKSFQKPAQKPAQKPFSPLPPDDQQLDARHDADAGNVAKAAPSPDQPLTPVRRQPANPQKFRVRVGESAIDGQGAFAAEPIPARRKIGEMRGEFIDMREARARAREAERSTGRIFMVAISEHRAVDATHSSDPLRFANHACVPNMVLKVQQGRVAFYALRDIAEGEELTARYGATHHAGRLRCLCGAARCIGWL